MALVLSIAQLVVFFLMMLVLDQSLAVERGSSVLDFSLRGRSKSVKQSVQKLASIPFGCPGLDGGDVNMTCSQTWMEKRWGPGVDCSLRVPFHTKAFFISCPPGYALVEEYTIITCKFPGKWDNDVFTCDEIPTTPSTTTKKTTAKPTTKKLNTTLAANVTKTTTKFNGTTVKMTNLTTPIANGTTTTPMGSTTTMAGAATVTTTIAGASTTAASATTTATAATTTTIAGAPTTAVSATTTVAGAPTTVTAATTSVASTTAASVATPATVAPVMTTVTAATTTPTTMAASTDTTMTTTVSSVTDTTTAATTTAATTSTATTTAASTTVAATITTTPPTSTTTATGVYGQKHDGMEYRLIKLYTSWDKAEAMCVADGAHLATVKDKSKLDHLMKIATNAEILLGYTDKIVQGTFVAQDGTPMPTFVPFNARIGTSNDCLKYVKVATQYDPVPGLADIPCGYETMRTIICEK